MLVDHHVHGEDDGSARDAVDNRVGIRGIGDQSNRIAIDGLKAAAVAVENAVAARAIGEADIRERAFGELTVIVVLCRASTTAVAVARTMQPS